MYQSLSELAKLELEAADVVQDLGWELWVGAIGGRVKSSPSIVERIAVALSYASSAF